MLLFLLAFLVTKIQVSGIRPPIVPTYFNFDIDRSLTMNSFLTKIVVSPWVSKGAKLVIEMTSITKFVM